MSNVKLQDAVAVVTGASRGIGRATAVALAREGAHVVCTARSTEAAPAKLPGTVEETAREVRALGRRALAIPCNISREEEVEAMAAATLAEFGRVDVLVNNAAVNHWAPLAETTTKRWDLVLNVNLRGTFLCTRAFLPAMLERAGAQTGPDGPPSGGGRPPGRIVNISSGAAVDVETTVELGIIPYSVSKAAVEKLTEGLGLELRPRGVAVNCLRIEMGIATEGARLMNPDMDLSDWEKPDAAADAIIWLATREPAYTGKVVTIADVREALARGS